MTLNDLWARFKVIDALNAAKMTLRAVMPCPSASLYPVVCRPSESDPCKWPDCPHRLHTVLLWTYVVHSCRWPEKTQDFRTCPVKLHTASFQRADTRWSLMPRPALSVGRRRRRSQQSRRRLTHGMSASRRLKRRSGQAQVLYADGTRLHAKFHRCTVPTLPANPDYATDAYINTVQRSGALHARIAWGRGGWTP